MLVLVVPGAGFEPARLSANHFKWSAAASYAIRAALSLEATTRSGSASG